VASIQADLLADRRRLKRRLQLWQVLGLAGVVGLALLGLDRLGLSGDRPHIARLTVDGVIFDDLDRSQALSKLADDDAVKALIVRIDSPGGTVVGGEELYRQLRAVAKDKPVAAVMREIATSAAYMAALGSDRIIAREGSITGSIGVIVQTTDVTELLESIGVKPEAIKSSPLKAQPNPLEPLTPEAREAVQVLITDIYEMFVGLVAERRALTPEQARNLADGRVFTGKRALELGLIDGLGGEAEARQWLIDEHTLDPDLEIRSVEVRSRRSLTERLLGSWGKMIVPERLRVDGLVALWHPGRLGE
jgi:protease IV